MKRVAIIGVVLAHVSMAVGAVILPRLHGPEAVAGVVVMAGLLACAGAGLIVAANR